MLYSIDTLSFIVHSIYDAGLINFPNWFGICFQGSLWCNKWGVELEDLGTMSFPIPISWLFHFQPRSHKRSVNYIHKPFFPWTWIVIWPIWIGWLKHCKQQNVNCDLTYFIIRSTCSLSAFDISHPPLYKVNGARRSQNINIQICHKKSQINKVF